ncbi:MAG: murein biosynthesis integral membrane protein MurJ [Gammaproteobacteria bacterium]|nr:MAG: murein biosynthesis integral membrane protein MurJ [Gammaproteobacteria bacterium]
MSKGLLKSSVSVSAMTFLSRILGFVRDVIIARIFGASLVADAFFVAFKIPNFLRRLFAEGAFSLAFVPVFSEYKTQREEADVKRLADGVAASLGLILLVVTVIGVIAAPVLVTIFAPGFIGNEGKFELAVDMLRITFPYIFFISLTAFAGSILNSYGRFAIPAFTPVLLNISLIFAAIVLAPHFDRPIMALAWGVFIAGAAQLLFQLPFLAQIRMLPRPRRGADAEGVSRIKKMMLPALFGSSVAQINLLLDTLIASFLVTGSISWLYYSDRLVEFPLGVFGVALATVILPRLSQQHTLASPQQFSQTLDWALRWVVIIALPSTMGLMLLAEPMLVTLFQYGAFNEHDVTMAGRSLLAYSLGLGAFIMIKILAAGFYSRHDMKTPVKIAVITMAVNMVMNIILVFPLAHAGLALATSLSAWLNAGWLLYLLRRDGIYQSRSGWQWLLLRTFMATLSMAVVLFFLVPALSDWVGKLWYERGIALSLWLLLGAGVYLASLFLFGLRWRHVSNETLH